MLRFGTLALAAATALLSGGLAAVEGSIAGASLAGASAVLALCALLSRDGKRPPAVEALLEKAAEQVETGRKLVIYERETGLFAHWYVTLRGQEECDRAGRYKRPLAIVVIEPTPQSDAWAVKEYVANWLAKHMRAADVAGYLGNGRCVAVLPETDAEAASIVIGRLQADVGDTDVACSVFPHDGTTFDQLYEAAAARIRGVAARVA